MFGAGAMTNSIEEIRDADFLFVIGSNTTEAHPVIALRMKKAARRGATIVVADPTPGLIGAAALTRSPSRI